MRIICDTNIWYGLGYGSIDKSKIPDDCELVITLLSIIELTHSPRIIDQIHLVKNGLISSMNDSDKRIFYNPIEYLRYLDNRLTHFNPIDHHKKVIEMAGLIANGFEVSNQKEFTVVKKIY